MKTLNQIIPKAVKLVAVVLLAGSFSSVPSAAAPVISGFIDTTYNYNLSKPANNANQLRAFDYRSNTFALQSAQVQLTGTMGPAGYVVKVIGGSDAAVIKRLDVSGTTQDVLFQEAYGTFACPVTGINAKFGKFATPEGIEVTESKDNPTISRGYLYTLAEPVNHTGVVLSRAFGKIDI